MLTTAESCGGGADLTRRWRSLASGPLTCTGSFQGPKKEPSKALEMPWNLTVHVRTKFYSFPKSDDNPKNLHVTTSYELRNWKKLF